MESTEKRTNYLGGTGLGLGAGALGLLLLQNGALGNIIGGNRPPVGDPPWSRDMNYERQLTKADAKIGKLEAQIYTDEKVNELRRELQASTAAQQVFNSTVSAAIATTAEQTKQLMNMTSLYISQPVMAASEGALSYSPFKSSAANASTSNAG